MSKPRLAYQAIAPQSTNALVAFSRAAGRACDRRPQAVAAMRASLSGLRTT